MPSRITRRRTVARVTASVLALSVSLIAAGTAAQAAPSHHHTTSAVMVTELQAPLSSQTLDRQPPPPPRPPAPPTPTPPPVPTPPPAPPRPPAPPTPPKPTPPQKDEYARVLQLDMCSSGYLPCYNNGKSVGEAVELLGQTKPEIVTTTGVCIDDLEPLTTKLHALWPEHYLNRGFLPSVGANGAQITCRNGSAYGIAIIAMIHKLRYTKFNAVGQRYAAQTNQSERRGYACIEAVGSYFACATALAPQKPTAGAQCRELFGSILPRIHNNRNEPTIVTGSFNLEATGNPGMDDCVGRGWTRDGEETQHVVATADRQIPGVQSYDFPSGERNALLSWVSSFWSYQS